MLASYEQLFGEPVPKRETHAPLEPGDHPEIDNSPLMDMEDIKKCWQMIREIPLARTLAAFEVFYKKTAIKFNTEVPDYSNYKVEKKNWRHIYHPCQEEIPEDMAEPCGKPVMATTFIDANSLQNTVETANYGSKFVPAGTAVDQIFDLCYTLRMFSVPLPGPSWMFGDNLYVVNSATMPSGKLLKHQNNLNFHRVREAQAAGIINFVHIDGKHYPADICTKHTFSFEWYELMKPLIFWHAMNDTLGSH
eukprot:8948610-Ditylum_brightwellii.AAC.2